MLQSSPECLGQLLLNACILLRIHQVCSQDQRGKQLYPGAFAVQSPLTLSVHCKHAITTCNTRLEAAGCMEKDMHVKQRNDMKKKQTFQGMAAELNCSFTLSFTKMLRFLTVRLIVRYQKSNGGKKVQSEWINPIPRTAYLFFNKDKSSWSGSWLVLLSSSIVIVSVY